MFLVLQLHKNKTNVAGEKSISIFDGFFQFTDHHDVLVAMEICLHNFLKFCYMLCVHIEWAPFALLFIHAGSLHVYLSRFRKQSVL